ncbi:MAG: DNA repair protein RadC [Thermodesulfobacteriota bacterium]
MPEKKGGIFIPQDEEVPHYVGHVGHRKRLKARFIRSGLDSFQDYEVVEFILTYALGRKDTKPLAKTLIQTFGSLRGIVEAPIEELEKVQNIGEHGILLFKLIKEASERYLRDRFLHNQDVITSPGDLVAYCQSKMGWLKDEQFRLIYLNTRNQVIEEEVLQEGIVDQTVVYPRKVMERAILLKATALILVHNHPAGSPYPSPEDRELTRTLTQAARNLQIKVHDHLIMGREGHFSFLENNLL